VRTRDRVGLYCFLVFSIFVCEESWRFGLGNFSSPGPGFLPLGASAILGILAIIRLIAGRKQAVEKAEPFFERKRLFKFVVVVLICFGYGLLLYRLGFVLCTGVFVLISLKVIEPKSWGKAVFVSVVTAFAAWLLFDYWLQIQTPKGTWVHPVYEKIGQVLWK
jgi:hypothetical protein